MAAVEAHRSTPFALRSCPIDRYSPFLTAPTVDLAIHITGLEEVLLILQT